MCERSQTIEIFFKTQYELREIVYMYKLRLDIASLRNVIETFLHNRYPYYLRRSGRYYVLQVDLKQDIR